MLASGVTENEEKTKIIYMNIPMLLHKALQL